MLILILYFLVYDCWKKIPQCSSQGNAVLFYRGITHFVKIQR